MSSSYSRGPRNFLSSFNLRRRSVSSAPGPYAQGDKDSIISSSSSDVNIRLPTSTAPTLIPSARTMPSSQRARLIKTGAIASLLVICAYYLFSSRNEISFDSLSKGTGLSTSTGANANLTAIASPSASADASAITPGSGGNDSGSGSESGRKGRCTKPFDPSKSLTQYVLMIDAGSTGSRIHVYQFNNCGPTPELEHEEFKMTEKRKGGSGLSSYKGDPLAAASSLDPLLDHAVQFVPEQYRSCSPISVKATAGLRMIGQEMADEILKAVRHRLETRYPFPVVDSQQGGVEIMDGKYEGIYAWITTNYLLGKIGSPEKKSTAAVFDLGGGSTQIVFEPSFKPKSGEHLTEGEHKYTLKFGGLEYVLYQHSHLGYGLMAARETVHRSLVETKARANPQNQAWIHEPLVNPCIVPGMTTNVNVTLPRNHPLGSVVPITMVGPKQAYSSAAQCRGIVSKILNKNANCTLQPCSFNGVHQPSLSQTFAVEDIYIFSYFYDRLAPLGFPSSFTLRDLSDLTALVCKGEDNWGVFEGIEGALDELRDRGEYCLDLNFMLGLLHDGYNMPLSREVNTAKKLKGNELGWCLGASLPLLSQDSGWKCRVKQVA